MKMPLTPKQAQLVEVHGHRIERMFGNGHGTKANWHSTKFASRPGLEENSLTESEEDIVESIKDTFYIKRLRRPPEGVDFIFGNVGFEAKPNKYYNLSETKMEAVEMLEATFIIVSDGTGPYIYKVVR